jgi:hypothetical protein
MSTAVIARCVALAASVAIVAAAPSTLAQQDADQPAAGAPKPKPAKKKAHPKKKPADADTAPAAADDTKPADADTKPAAADDTKAADADTKPPVDEKKPAAPEEATPKESEDDNTNTWEDPDKRYYFIGLRDHLTVIPQFVENLFVDEGRTIVTNSIGAEIDIRKGGQSMIPWIVYADYSMGDTLFHEKGATPTGQPGDAGNYSVVNSSLKSVYLGLDELWSVPIDKTSHHWDFEFGFGVGVGVIFGNLQNDWVFLDPNGPLTASNGNRYSECQPLNQNISCQIPGHNGATVQKAGGYVEKNWFQGGAVPVFFPYISFPQLGIRYKPIKQMEARLGVGFSLTGFWFGLSANYGLEQSEVKHGVQPEGNGVKPTSSLARLHDML